MSALQARFREELHAHAAPAPGERLLVALSGGLDSVVLLHLLRFGGATEGVDVVAAHFDHTMRSSSGDDALWVRGLCRAWGVPLHVGRAPAAPGSEEEARRARYAFLERVRVEVGARLVLTAHHADDQAETVLFRAVRGTGQAGLAGIPARREPGICRPLLRSWRDELEEYAKGVRLTCREDPTNAMVGYARNAIRHRILPEIERLVAPGARAALVRLADLAREDEAGWASVLPALMEPLRLSVDAHGFSLDRTGLVALHPAVQARILRHLAADVGARFDERATRLALELAGRAASGRTIALGGAWTLRSDLDRLVLARVRDVAPDIPLLIPDAGPGAGDARIAGERVAVVWGSEASELAGRAVRCSESFDPGALRFPLTVRAREPGDRIRLAGGAKKVKKLFLERRLPTTRRERAPLLVDAEGDVLWIPEVARADLPRGGSHGGAVRIGIG
ncbi:MAG TPA: tRNA lysidine(34) synthetase TilS [Longimicrobiales bacterium]|nr:tRNA lysidine(34) synthetase TilS [Longimicrobiales bacterium]